ncbi:MAG: MraY family glycosyltransferase, partial [Bacteroidota bacterium]
MTSSPIIFLLFPLLAAFALSMLFLPAIIRLSILKGWFDLPDARKVHAQPIPRTGGMVLAPTIAAAVFMAWLPTADTLPFGLGLGMLILYLTGLRDDLVGVKALPKLGLQMAAGVVLAASGWRIMSLGGGELPIWMQYGLTVFAVTAVVNAYNLIDGIDGLAASLAVLAGATFAWLFYQAGDLTGLVIAAAMVGGYAAFLW